jgi:hypothetical protein
LGVQPRKTTITANDKMSGATRAVVFRVGGIEPDTAIADFKDALRETFPDDEKDI